MNRPPGGPSPVFIDTSAFYDLVNNRQRRHQEAVAIFRRLGGAGAHLFTTNFVLTEVHALLVGRDKRPDKGSAFLDSIYGSDSIRLIRVDEPDEQRARALLARYQDKLFSFVDATSFVIMERLKITHAFSFDDDFTQYGLITLTSANLPV
jgi:predicted nucleic acid-binding protein